MTFNMQPHQSVVYRDFMKQLEDRGQTPTGRSLVNIERDRCRDRATTFGYIYGSPSIATGYTPFNLEMNLADLERRLPIVSSVSNIRRSSRTEKLFEGHLGHLYGVRLIMDESHPLPEIDFEPPVKDFARAKTGKEQLQSRLSKKMKAKPSGLLSKLVAKK